MNKLTCYHMSYHYRSSHTSWYPGCPEEVPFMRSSHLMRSPRNPTAREVPARGGGSQEQRGWKAEREQFPPNPAFTSLKKNDLTSLPLVPPAHPCPSLLCSFNHSGICENKAAPAAPNDRLHPKLIVPPETRQRWGFLWGC